MAVSIGIIGWGAIGRTLGLALAQGQMPGARLVGIYDRAPETIAAGPEFAHALSVGSLRDLAQAADFLIEAASAAAVPGVIAAAIEHKREVMVLSVGALLLDPTLAESMRRAGCRLHFPSGAICGLDGLKAAMLSGEVEEVTVETRKPPSGLPGAASAARVQAGEILLFEGNAREAVAQFPANVNVAAAVALNSLGPERTRVRIIADPAVQTNQHTLRVAGRFGVLESKSLNQPFPENPKTSWLAALSALALLRERLSGQWWGS
jgi:aspartate dehydrogenase